MSVGAQAGERLAALTAAGTSVWLHHVRRGLVESGELRRLIEEDCLRGVTSNPKLFEKAVLGSSDYDGELAAMADEGLDAAEMLDRIAVRDVQLAADVLRPVWEATGGTDGFVSFEVGPRLAPDARGTIEAAQAYWDRVDRPNLMVMIPGTEAGMAAVEEAIGRGLNVNVTLLFSVARYGQAQEAFLSGLERRRAAGQPLDVHSVASFSISRVDAEVDRRLERLGRTDLAGTGALANARLAYQRFKEVFHGERFADLRGAGAPVQRPLWASTGRRNPHYSETKYVDGLVGPEAVCTMPMATLLAAAQRAEVQGATADEDIEATYRTLEALADAGIDLDDVTATLLREGVERFEALGDRLLAAVESRRHAVTVGRPTSFESFLPGEVEPGVTARVRRAEDEDVVRRIWRKDESLWDCGPEIAERLGWLTVSEHMREAAADFVAFGKDCARDGLTDVVLLGMGGSSLAPEVLRQSFEPAPDALRLHVLDSTDPGAVLSLERRLDLERTLFLVSTKSGGTTETVSLFRYFYERARERLGSDAGGRFVAITDPGSPLAKLAREHGFRRIFLNDPAIGGRYSALSLFGLVPAALMGIDVDALLDAAEVAQEACAGYTPSAHNPGLWVGAAIGELAARGRDKLTFAACEPIDSFGLWAEQLVAESTGKQGTGVVPVAGEPLGAPDAYGDDRVFVHLRLADKEEARFDREMLALEEAGHPVITLFFDEVEDLGRIFFLAEFATAVAGWALAIDPFDEPNVQQAKDETQAVLERWEADGRLPDVAEVSGEALRDFLAGTSPPRYVALMGYLEPSSAVNRAVDGLRAVIRDATRSATTFGYGPRFLHSTGQLHKGGPPTGVFLQLLHDGPEDPEVPGAGYTFGTLKNAQAIGDLETLRRGGLSAERVRLEGDPARAIESLTEQLRAAL